MADPLYPQTREKRMKYLLARDAGRKAAEYVIDRWPSLFPSREFCPDIRPKRPSARKKISLQYLTSQRETEKALKRFAKLKVRGRDVSLRAHNLLLELLAVSGHGNREVHSWQQFHKAEHQVDGSSSDDGEELEFITKHALPSDSGYSPRGELIENLVNEEKLYKSVVSHFPKKVWSSNNDAEKFLENMTEKNAGTYNALMVGMYKYKSFNRMFKLYKTMRDGGYQATVSTYNYLLLALEECQLSNGWDMGLELARDMAAEAVQPNTTTFNALLKLSLSTGEHSTANSQAIFSEMLHVGVEPNLTSLLRLLQARVYHHLDSSVLYSVMDYLKRNPQILKLETQTDLFLLQAALCLARYNKDVDTVRAIFEMGSKDYWHLVGIIEMFMSEYIVAVATIDNLQAAVVAYKQLVPLHFKPNYWVYESLFRACEKAESPDTAVEFWNDMKRHRVVLKSANPVARLFAALGQRNIDSAAHVTAGEEALTELSKYDLIPNSFIIGRMVKLYCNNGQIGKAWDMYGHFKKYNLQPIFIALVSLLKFHAYVEGNATKVLEVLQTIAENGFPFPKSYEAICRKLDLSAADQDKLMKQFKANQNTAATSRRFNVTRDD